MDFTIQIKKVNRKNSVGEIKIGSFCETFEMPMIYWNCSDYETQWRLALERLVSGRNSCLITSILDPQRSNFIFWWPIYIREQQVIIHNQILFLDRLNEKFRISDPYHHIPTYSSRGAEGDEISEWFTTIDAIRSFLASA